MNKLFLTLLASTVVLAPCQHAFSAGFALFEQSVTGMGTAYAGSAALAEDASTIYFNPAGLTRICGLESVNGYYLFLPSIDYDDKGSFAISSFNGTIPNGFQPLNGNDGRNAGEIAGLSHSYYSWRVNNCFAVGLGLSTPFGLVTDYDHHWKGRYYALRSQLLTININPCVAYKFNRCWSIGVGVDVMYLHAKLSNKIDIGLIGLQQLGPVLAGLFGFVPQETDGYVKLKGNSWGYGGNIGVLWEPCCGTRLGLHYRTEIKQRIKGSEKFEDLPEAFENPLLAPLAAAFEDTRARAQVTFPSTTSLSAYHEFNSCWAIVGDITWTKWDVLKRIRFKFSNEAQPEAIITLKWENVFRYSLGMIYRPNCCWTFRVGGAYDEGPTPNKELRSPRIPDADRIWAACGAGYQWSQCLHFDFGYAHIFAPKFKIDKQLTMEENVFRGALRGEYDAFTDILCVQVVWNF